jgi:hypothetical protein
MLGHTAPFPDSPPAGEAPVDADHLFSALRSRRSRLALAALYERDDPVAPSDLAAAVAARERETRPADVDADAVERVRVALHHDVVPSLEDAGVVAYDAGANRVALTDDAGSVTELLEELALL